MAARTALSGLGILLLFLLVACSATQTVPQDAPAPQAGEVKAAPTDNLEWSPGMSWYWQLQGDLDLSHDVEVYDVDLFDTSAGEIAALQQRGVKVVCYVSAGTHEPWRSDSFLFASEAIGNPVEGFEEEQWLDVKHSSVRDAMSVRLALAATKGCNAVEADNVDGYMHDTRFEFGFEDQLEYNRWLAETAHQNGLSIGLKNDLEQVNQLHEHFDFAVNEQCFQYEECDLLKVFTDAGKPVFNTEYELDRAQFCDEAKARHISAIKATVELDGDVEFC